MSVALEDPFHWTVDDVVHNVCHSRDIWRDWPNPALPDPVVFEKVLRDNDVNGATLLSLEDVGLLNIRSLGQRMAMSHAIDVLRLQSSRFVQHRAMRKLSLARIDSEASALSLLSPRGDTPMSTPGVKTERRQSQTGMHPLQVSTNASPLLRKRSNSSDEKPVNLRPGEHEVLLNGRKRRRITSAAQPTDTERSRRHRNAASPDSERNVGAHYFLGPHQMPLDPIFYNNNNNNSNNNSESEDDEFSFQSKPSMNFPGQQLHLSRRLQHFYSRAPQKLDQDTVLVEPYPDRVVKEGNARSVMLYKKDHGTVTVSRRNARLLEETIADGDNYSWDFLTKWNDQQTELLPAYGESDASMDSETWNEVQAEQQELARLKEKILDEGTVASVIDAVITEFRDKWQSEVRPRREVRARSIWKRLKGRRGTFFAANVERKLSHLVARLEGIRKEISREAWKKEHALRHQCKSMGLTVSDIEDMKWQLQVSKRTEAPARPPKVAQVLRPRRAEHPTDSEESILESELESDGNFIEWDDDDDDDAILQPRETAELKESDGVAADSDPELNLSNVVMMESSAEKVSDVVPAPPSETKELDVTSVGPTASNPELEDGTVPVDSEETGELDITHVDKIAELDSSILSPNPQEKLELDTAKPDSIVSIVEDDDEAIESKSEETTELILASEIPNAPSVDLDNDVFLSKPGEEVKPDLSNVESTAPTTEPKDGGPIEIGEDLEENRVDGELSPDIQPRAGPITGSTGDMTEIIDLTGEITSAPQSEDEVTPRMPSRAETPRPGPKYGPEPEQADPDEIDLWDWNDLVVGRDRKRIVIKLFNELPPPARSVVQSWILKLDEKDFQNEVVRGLLSMQHQKNLESPSLIATKLWACWYHCDRKYMIALGANTDPGVLKELRIAKDFTDFYTCLRTYIENSGLEVDDSPRKQRKRPITRAEVTAELQRSAQKNREEGLQRAALRERTTTTTNAQSGVIINPTRHEGEEPIYVHNDIASKIKAHQIEGVQFIWRNLIVDRTEHERAPGCLLAHTMGLGKTMQVITVLRTIAEASCSNSPAIVEQIPPSLRQSRSLILCPASLVNNWSEEFAKWGPSTKDLIGKIYATATDRTDHAARMVRYRVVEKWYRDGGVLLLSYETFRGLYTNGGKAQLYTHETHEALKVLLLQGPHIIVADEAHRLKNKTSGLSMAAAQFTSKYRIALTGSPLANNLGEYHAMMDWAAPAFLGNAVEFKYYYEEPIEAGIFADSTKSEQRTSLKKLAELKRDLDPKVHRAGVEALEMYLKQKTEFVVKLALTSIQQSLYSIFVESLSQLDTELSNTTVFDWASLLALLCAHPQIFMAKLQLRQERKSLSRQTQRRLAEDGDEDDATGLELPDNMLRRLRGVFDKDYVGDVYAAENSSKMSLLKQIVTDCKRIGDRLLIFTQSRLTLDFLERMIQAMGGIRTIRLDGTVSVNDRQNMTHDFNGGRFDVFLISTRAGGLGLNLPGANRVILVDFGWNPTWEEQAIGRAFRFGQQKAVFVYHLVVGGTFEDHLHQITLFKKQLAMRVVDHKNPQRQASRVKEVLAPVKEVPAKDLAENRGKDAVLDHLMAAFGGTSIRQIQTTSTLHREEDERLTEEETREVEATRTAKARGRAGPL